MKRPFFAVGVVFACTTWLAFLFDSRTAFLLSIALFVTAILLYALKLKNRNSALILIISASLAFANYVFYDSSKIAPFRNLSGAKIEIQGVLLEKTGDGKSSRYTIEAKVLGENNLPLRNKIIMRSYGDLSYQLGDTVRCVLKVDNPDKFSANSFYRSKGIVLVGNLISEVHIVPQENFNMQSFLLGFREKLNENLYIALKPDNAAVVSAMVLGLQADVPSNIYTAVSRSGTAHLLSISGLHLAIFTTFVLAVLRKLRIPIQVSNIVAVIIAFLFSGLVGFSASITRSFIMTGSMLILQVIRKKISSADSLGISLLIICAIRPFWALGISLWLSATSTAGIVLFAPTSLKYVHDHFAIVGKWRYKFVSLMVDAAVVSLCAYVFSVPVLLLATGSICLVSPLANMFVAPFITPLILGGIFCTILPNNSILAFITQFCVEMVIRISTFFSNLSFATYAIDEAYNLIILFAILIAIFVIIKSNYSKNLRIYSALLLVICLSIGQLSLLFAKQNTIELAVLKNCDTAVLIRGDNAVLLGTPTRYNVNKLIKYLDFRSIRTISAIIATDCSENIDSGIIRMVERFPTDLILGPDDSYILSQLESALPHNTVLSGGYAQAQILGDAYFFTSAIDSKINIKTYCDNIIKVETDYNFETKTDDIIIFNDGVIVLPLNKSILFEPIGKNIFGEVRVNLHTA